MQIPNWWSTTNLDAVGVLLQRMGGMFCGVAVGFGFAQYAAKSPFLYGILAAATGLGLFVLAEYRIQVQNKKRSAT
jgi:hypothetical protein